MLQKRVRLDKTAAAAASDQSCAAEEGGSAVSADGSPENMITSAEGTAGSADGMNASRAENADGSAINSDSHADEKDSSADKKDSPAGKGLSSDILEKLLLGAEWRRVHFDNRPLEAGLQVVARMFQEVGEVVKAVLDSSVDKPSNKDDLSSKENDLSSSKDDMTSKDDAGKMSSSRKGSVVYRLRSDAKRAADALNGMKVSYELLQ